MFSTTVSTAVKVHKRRQTYERELLCYERLRHFRVVEVLEFNVPQLIAWDDELLVIEMTIVTPPFLLDFASAHLDTAPDFANEIMENWHEEKREQFGERWDDVQVVLAHLKGHYGIHVLDVNPGNITFRENED